MSWDKITSLDRITLAEILNSKSGLSQSESTRRKRNQGGGREGGEISGED